MDVYPPLNASRVSFRVLAKALTYTDLFSCYQWHRRKWTCMVNYRQILIYCHIKYLLWDSQGNAGFLCRISSPLNKLKDETETALLEKCDFKSIWPFVFLEVLFCSERNMGFLTQKTTFLDKIMQNMHKPAIFFSLKNLSFGHLQLEGI